MAKTKHTNGPWTFVWRKVLQNFRIGRDDDSMPVAGTFNQGNRELEEANAEFICRACNAHEELLGVCKLLAAREVELHSAPNQPYSVDDILVRQANAAIANANAEIWAWFRTE